MIKTSHLEIYVNTATGQCLSANQAYKYIRKLVAGFRAIGLQKSDCVCIHSFNNYPILVQGIVAAGGIFVGTNPNYTPYELEHAIKTSKAEYLIVEPEILAAPKTVASNLSIPNERILLFADATNNDIHPTWRDLLNHGEEDWVRFNDLETAKNTTAFLIFSSGTTDLPKATQLSHYNLIAEHTLDHKKPAHPPPWHISLLCPLPFFHAAMAPYVHTSTLRSGVQTFVMRRFELAAYLAAAEKYSITKLMLVPPMVLALLNFSLSNPNPNRVKKALKSVKSMVGGAAPLDAETQARFQCLLPPGSSFTQLWAITETSCVATYFCPPESDNTGSVGSHDIRGELCVRGPTIICGYLDNPTANAESWDEGYFHTGDIAVLSSRNDLWYIVDRKKELMKVRGFQVAPAEIEGAFLAHPGVEDVAVFGVNLGKGEVPRAHVVKGLEGVVSFVESMPKTPSGKILKRYLREEAKKEIGRSSKL